MDREKSFHKSQTKHELFNGSPSCDSKRHALAYRRIAQPTCVQPWLQLDTAKVVECIRLAAMANVMSVSAIQTHAEHLTILQPNCLRCYARFLLAAARTLMCSNCCVCQWWGSFSRSSVDMASCCLDLHTVLVQLYHITEGANMSTHGGFSD